MSMFENKTKPELESGNFIAYADEPNTVVDGSGGGSFTVFNGTLGEDATTVIVDFSYADIVEALGDGNPVFLYVSETTYGTKTMFLLKGAVVSEGVYTVTFDVINFVASDETSTMTMAGD